MMALVLPISITKEILGQISPSRFLRKGFFQNLLVVMTSTGLAQFITVCFSPLLSRIYEPDDFGFYGTFVSIVGIMSAVMTLQFSEALMLPETDVKAAGLFWAAGLSCVAVTAVASLAWVLFPSWWKGVFRIEPMNGWLWLAPVAAMTAGVNQTLTAWCARRKAFKRAATVQVGRSITANSGQTAAGLAGWDQGGLISGALLADVLAGIGLIFWVVREDGAALRAGANRKTIASGVREHKDFARYSTPQNLLNAASQGAPVILLIYYFGAAIGGVYAFAIRVLQFPMNFVLTSLNQVLFQRLSEVHNRGGDLKRLFVHSTCALLGLSVLPAIIGFILAPQIFGLAFGEKWILAGEYSRWLLIWLVPGFCNLPAALIGRILRQQRNLLLFDLALLLSRITVLVLGGIFGTALQTIVGFSVVGAVFNIVLILFIWRVLNARAASVAAEIS